MRPTVSILHYLSDRNSGNLFYQTAIGAGHSQVTLTYGLECSDNKDYFIDRCNYDQAGGILQHIYGALRPRKDNQPLGELLSFDQREFTLPASPASYSLAETGYAYFARVVRGLGALPRPCRTAWLQAELRCDRGSLHSACGA
jgi:hypothetical protein